MAAFPLKILQIEKVAHKRAEYLWQDEIFIKICTQLLQNQHFSLCCYARIKIVIDFAFSRFQPPNQGDYLRQN